MKKSKRKFVLAGLVLLAAIIAGLTLTGCETEVESCGHSYDNDCDTTCNQCGSQRPARRHTPGADDGDCTTEVKCTVCGEVAVAAKSHDFSGGWQKDAGKHWHNCKNGGCNKNGMIAAHTGGTATCVKGKLCETCDHEYSDVDDSAHLWGVPEYTLDEDKTQCTATVSCQHDNNHKETETVEATPKDGQTNVYTLQFTNPLFPMPELDMNVKGPGVTAGSWAAPMDGGGLETE